MVLDESTRTHLELFHNNEDRGRVGTLLECLDCSTTPLGSRRVAHWLRYPLLRPEEIRERQDGVGFLADRDRVRGRVREALRGVKDLERILTKAIRPTASPRDLGVLRTSLTALPGVGVSMTEKSEAAGLPLDASDGAWPSVLVLPEPLPELESLLLNLGLRMGGTPAPETDCRGEEGG